MKPHRTVPASLYDKFKSCVRGNDSLTNIFPFLYLFDHMIVPILNYASEIWGFEEWSKLETLHKKACKYALGI